MIPSRTLNDGTTLPALGLGTWPLTGTKAVDAIVSGLHAGYRLIDSAVNYENEGAVGEAVRRSGVPREEIVITSKLPGRHHSYAQAIACAHESAFRLGVEQIDLYLIHWPNPITGRYSEAWQALVDLQRDGLLRSIGVSNFLPEHLNRIIAETGVIPAVNQIELHPRFAQAEQRSVDTELGILTESWSPLGRGDLFAHQAITTIAEAVGRTPAQVILRWQLQLGCVPLPKAAGPARQAENLDVFDFELDEAQLASISALTQSDGRLFDADPSRHEEM